MSLFDKNHRYTNEATQFENEIDSAIRPIIDKFVKMGHSPHELQYLASCAAEMICLNHLLDMSFGDENA